MVFEFIQRVVMVVFHVCVLATCHGGDVSHRAESRYAPHKICWSVSSIPLLLTNPSTESSIAPIPTLSCLSSSFDELPVNRSSEVSFTMDSTILAACLLPLLVTAAPGDDDTVSFSSHSAAHCKGIDMYFNSGAPEGACINTPSK